MDLGRKEATYFGMPRLPLIEVPHHPSGGARPGEHRQDAEIVLEPVNAKLTLAGAPQGLIDEDSALQERAGSR